MSKRTETPPSHSKGTTADSEPTAAKQARNLLCWGCGSEPAREGERLGWTCTRAGIDPHWIPCTTHDHDHVRRRTWRGQQSFTCTTTPH